MHNRGSETVRPSCRGWDNQNACTNAWAVLMDGMGGFVPQGKSEYGDCVVMSQRGI